MGAWELDHSFASCVHDDDDGGAKAFQFMAKAAVRDDDDRKRRAVGGGWYVCGCKALRGLVREFSALSLRT